MRTGAARTGAVGGAGLAMGLTTAVAGAGPMVGSTHDGMLVEIDRTNGALTPIGPLNAGSSGITGMAFDSVNGVLYGSNPNGELRSIDYTTGASTLIGSGPVANMDALAFHPTTGVLYGASHGRFLWTIDTSTGVPTQIAQISGASEVMGLTFDSSGALYGMADGGNEFVSIDIGSGSASVLVNMDSFANPGFWHTVEYDPAADLFYARQGNGPGSHCALYAIDRVAATATLIGTDSLQAPGIFGMAIIPTPGATAIIGVAGLMSLRRRRDQRAV